MPDPSSHTAAIVCRSGDRCPGYNPATKTAAPAGCTPLCEPCLQRAGRDTAALLYDYLDLEQLHAPSLAQALTGQPNGSPAPAMPLAAEPEALQAEIVWVTGVWEEILRDRLRLAPPARPQAAPWHTTVSNPPPAGGQRGGAHVQRATTLLTAHLDQLARTPPTTVLPAGCEDPPADLDGVDALTHLAALHHRARAMLGRTRRTFYVPGDCWQEQCATAHRHAVKHGHNPDQWLWRSEPAFQGDDPMVHCRYCEQPRPFEDYQRYVMMLVWPALHDQEAA